MFPFVSSRGTIVVSMEEGTEQVEEKVHEKNHEKPVTSAPSIAVKIKKGAWIAWLVLQYAFDRVADATSDNMRVIRREANLFLGTAFTIIGLMNFRNGKNCDGNTVDYLSCTRPSTFYYYTAFEMFLVTLGVSLILVWILHRFPHKESH